MNLYSSITSSIIKSIENFREANFSTASYLDWDAHADISSLPEGDLCGPAGMGFSQEDAKITVAFSYGLCTVGDVNLFRLREAMGLLLAQFQPQTCIPLYDETGVKTKHWIMIKTPVTVNPISKAQVRSIQFLTLVGLVDFGAASSN